MAAMLYRMNPNRKVNVESMDINLFTLDGPGILSRWCEFFRTCSDRLWGPPSLLYKGYRVFPGGKAAGTWRW